MFHLAAETADAVVTVKHHDPHSIVAAL